MKRFIVLLAATLALTRCAPAAAIELHRGVGLHGMMNWAERAEGSAIYADEPFSGEQFDIPDEILANVAKAGFDFIRLTVDPGPFLYFKGAKRDALDDALAANVRRLSGYGLAVVVDLHPNRQIDRFKPEAIVADEHGGLFDRYVALAGRTAKLLAGLKSERLAFELLNEPQIGYTDQQIEQWNRMQKRLHAAVRENAPDLPIIVTGGRSGGTGGLFDLDPAPFNDGNTLFSFHYYRPHTFTHQGVKSDFSSIRHLRYFSYVPYPAASGSPEAVWQGIKLAIDADNSLSPGARHEMVTASRKALGDYFASGLDRSVIDADFDEVLDWARANGVDPHNIFIGEFGVTRSYGDFAGADPLSRGAWLKDVTEAAAQRGYSWAYWSVLGFGEFSLMDRYGSNDLHAPTLHALGLKP